MQVGLSANPRLSHFYQAPVKCQKCPICRFAGKHACIPTCRLNNHFLVPAWPVMEREKNTKASFLSICLLHKNTPNTLWRQIPRFMYSLTMQPLLPSWVLSEIRCLKYYWYSKHPSMTLYGTSSYALPWAKPVSLSDNSYYFSFG